MDLTAAIKEAYANAPGDVTYYDTLQIDHEDFAAPILIVNSHAPTTRTEGEFLPVRFDFKLPETAGSVRGEMTISIAGVPASVRAAIRNGAGTRAPVTVTYRQYVNSDLDPSAEYPVPLSISAVRETYAGIEMTALAPDLTGLPFPRRLMTTKCLPGLL